MFGQDRRRERIHARRLLAVGFAIGLVAQSVSPAAAAAGDLDDTFDADLLGRSGLWDVVVQPADQKIVGVGQTDRGGLVGTRFLIARWNPDGSLDPTFAGDGIRQTNFGNGEDGASAVALQADGKIVAVGVAAASGGTFAIARYNTNGSPDTTFSGDGRTTTDFTTGYDYAADVVIQANQKIVVAGRMAGSDPRFAVARYNANGSLDGTFSGDGKTTVNMVAGEDSATALALQADGKIVLAGYANGAGGQIVVARLRTNGSMDPAFSGDGKLTRNLTKGLDLAWDVAIQPGDQKIVLAGRSGAGGGSMAALRYNPDGSPDSSFSGDGSVAINITTFDDVALGLALQADGKIVLAGTADGEFFATARLLGTGKFDTPFANGGVSIVNLSPGVDVAQAVAIQADGGIVVGGQDAGAIKGRIALIRLLGS